MVEKIAKGEEEKHSIIISSISTLCRTPRFIAHVMTLHHQELPEIEDTVSPSREDVEIS